MARARVSTESKMMMLRREIAKMVSYEGCDYRNMVIADAIAKGHESKLTTEWLRKVLLSDVEDGFITYGQAVTLNDIYPEVIEKLKAMV